MLDPPELAGGEPPDILLAQSCFLTDFPDCTAHGLKARKLLDLFFLSPFRIGDRADRAQIQMDIARGPVDVASVFVDIELRQLPACQLLQSGNIGTENFKAFQSTTEHHQTPVGSKRRLGDKIFLSTGVPSGQNAQRDRLIGVYEHVSESSEPSPIEHLGEHITVNVIPHKEGTKIVLVVRLPNNLAHIGEFRCGGKNEQATRQSSGPPSAKKPQLL